LIVSNAKREIKSRKKSAAWDLNPRPSSDVPTTKLLGPWQRSQELEFG